jgi:hypothetical protein
VSGRKVNAKGPKITGTPSGEIDVKRFYLPGVIVEQACPGCGVKCSNDLADQYLSYPPMNGPTKVYMGCECGEEWTIAARVEVRLVVEIKP